MNGKKNKKFHKCFNEVGLLVIMADLEDSGTDPGGGAGQLAAATPEKVSNYLKKIIPVILEDDEGLDNLALERAFNDKNGGDALKKFMIDPQCRSLLVSR